MGTDRRNNNRGTPQRPPQDAPSRSTATDEKRATLTQQHIDAQQKILKLEEKIAAAESLNLTTAESRARRERLIADLIQQRSDALAETRDIEEKIGEYLNEQEKTEKSIVELVRQRRENIKETKDLSDQIAKSLRDQAIDMVGVSDAGKKLTGEMSASTGFATSLGNITQKVNIALREGVDFSNEFMDVLQDTEKTRQEYRDLEMEIAKSAEKAAQGKYDAESMSADLAKKMNQLAKDAADLKAKETDFLKNIGDMTVEQIEAKQKELYLEREMLNARGASLAAMEEQHKVLEESSKTAEKTLGVLDKITSGDFKGALLQKFGLDDINKQLKEKVGGALVNVIDSVKKGDLKGAFAAAGGGLKDLTKLAGAFTFALGIGAIFKLGSFLLDTFMKADAEVAELGKNFGISKDEAKELHHTSVDVANEMGVVGVHAEQIAKGLENVSQNLGGIDLTGAFSSGNAAVQQMVKDTTLLTEKFGLSAEEAGNMSNIAAIAGKSVGEMSMMSSKLGNGIFSAKESMKILAGIPKSIVSQMAKMPEAMIKTAMHAKMLGMNMKQIADIGRKSLDIEQSLEAEMEARALIGKDINLDAMRAAALNGDQETVMNELLKTAGSMEDFNKMNVLQKEALAKAAGMEVDQMAEMLGKQEELNKAGLTQAKVKELQAMNEKDLAKEIANTNDKDKKAYLEKLAAEKKSESTQAAMASLMQRLQELAVKLVTPLMDMVDAFLNGQDGADAMGGLIDGIGGAIKAIVPYIKAIASVIGFLLKPLGWIGSMFKSTEEATHGVAEGAKGVASAIKPVESGFGMILKAAVGIGAIFAGKKLLGGVGKVVGKVLGAPGRLLGFGGKKGGDVAGGEDPTGTAGGAAKEAAKGKNIVSTILDKIKSIIDSIKGVVQSAIGFVRDVGKDLLSTLNDLIKGIGDILKTGADIVVNVGTKLAEGAMKILNIIMEGLSKAANTLPTIMGALGKAVVAFFQPMAALVNPMVIGGIIVFTAAMIGLGYAFKLLGEGIGAAAPGITAFFDGVSVVIEKVGNVIAQVIETITTSIIRLQDINGDKLLSTAAGIVAIGGAMAALGAGKAAEGFGSFVGSLFGGGEDPMEKLISFTERMKPEKLAETANGLKALTSTFSSFATAIETMAASLDKLNLDKLDAAIEKLEEAKKLNDMSIGEGIASAASSFVGGIVSIFGSSEQQSAQPVVAGAGGVGAVAGGGGGTNMANVEKKLDTLISVISQAANQPLVIKFGEKTVEEIKTQLNFKKASNIGVDKGYGKTV